MFQTIKSWFVGSKIKSEIMKLLDGRLKLAEQHFKVGLNDIADNLKDDLETAYTTAKLSTQMLTEATVKEVIADLTN